MNFDEKNLLLYGVTDRHWLNGRTLPEVVRESLEGGVTMVQLREKQLDDAQFLEEAVRIQQLCREFRVPFLINDRVDICLAVGADGVHVGQSDMEAGDVRAKLGPDKIIGVTAKTVAQAVLAEQRGANYLGVGAVFPTGTKSDTSVIDHQTLREICAAVSIPVVAIGGIDLENAALLRGSGIRGIAVVSAIYGQRDIRRAAAALKSIAGTLVTA